MTEISKMNLYEKIINITNELCTVKKNLNVGVGRSSYRAVGEADVLAAVKPLEYKYRVCSFPVSRRVIDSEVLTIKTNYKGTENEKNQTFMRVETVYRFLNVDNPEQYIDITSYGDGIDTGDKAPGKALTYSDKYALLKMYKITTGDDPDQYASPENGYEVSTPMPPRCEKCGALLEGMTDETGREWSAEKVARASLKKYNAVLCEDCRRKLEARDEG